MKQPSEEFQHTRTLTTRLTKKQNDLFKNLIISGKINPALRLLKDDHTVGFILPINNESLELLHEKHPKASPLCEELLLEGPVDKIGNVIFDAITPDLREVQQGRLY